MAYRDYKQFAAGEFFHVYNRGNGKMDVFRDGQDYRNFLKRLSTVLGINETSPVSKAPFDSRVRLTPFAPGTFSLVCYCLMPNHFHLCFQQQTEIPIGSLILRACTSYAKYFNRKYKHAGHVFQDRFSAVRIENDSQLAALSAYIHQNPKVAGLVDDLKDWPHSSYSEYICGRSILCDREWSLRFFKKPSEYEKFVEDRYDELRERKKIQLELLD